MSVATSSKAQYLTAANVAVRLNVSKADCFGLVRSGAIPARRLGRSFRISETATDRQVRYQHFSARKRGNTMSRNPFRIGDYVVADEPFNGRTEGVVMAIHGRCLGLLAKNGPSDHYIYYDYRTVALPG